MQNSNHPIEIYKSFVTNLQNLHNNQFRNWSILFYITFNYTIESSKLMKTSRADFISIFPINSISDNYKLHNQSF